MKHLFLLGLIGFCAVLRADEIPFYIGSTGENLKTQGIYRSTLDLDTGKLGAFEKVADAQRASFLAIDPTGDFLYTTAEGTPGAAAAYAINEDGTLKLLNREDTGGAGPTHIWLDGGAAHLLVANYDGGSIACLPIREDGTLGSKTAFVQHHGSSVNKERQKEPHAHGIYTDADDRFVYVPDLGTDKVMIYKFDPEKGSLAPNDPAAASVEPGSGPRHMAFQPSGGFAYVINEMASTIVAFKHDADTGALEQIQSISTLPSGFKGSNTTAEIAVHPNGRFAYGSNRGHDSIAAFSVADDTGKLTLIGHTPTGGKMPRNFAIDPTGKWLIVSNQGSGDLFVLKIDTNAGKLTPTGQSAKLPTPMSIAFPPRK